MSDWRSKLGAIKRQLDREKTVTLRLPPAFTFKHHGTINFEPCLRFFDWSPRDCPVRVDFTTCRSANYQALSLLVPYFWRLRAQGCRITTLLDEDNATSASAMWKRMGAQQLFHVSTDENTQFKGNEFKPLIGVRNTTDFKLAISTAEEFATGFDVEYINTLRYVLSELLYNTLEHGVSYFTYRGVQKRTPSVIQFTWYKSHNEIDFVVADIGVGIKEHLSQAYPGLESDEEAIRMALKPQVSGTFGKADPYKAKNNAGVGLYISSNIVRRLNADMYIVSGNCAMRVSPRDTTATSLPNPWQGAFVLVTLRVVEGAKFALHSMMQEFRDSAQKELDKGISQEEISRHYLSINNYFGSFAEDKQAAIRYRDDKLIPAINDGKIIVIDFDNVNYSPHSFLSALIATPAKILNMAAYKRMKIVNATPEIRETIDYILDENTEQT
jgi:hypothetical protein